MQAAEPLPPTVPELLADAPRTRARYPSHLSHRWRRSRIQPSFSFISRLLLRTRTTTHQDTPAASFYRIYTFFVLHDNIAFRNELEYFCRSHPEWPVSSLPDPCAPNASNDDPKGPSHDEQVRYTILAVLTRLMCDAFNRRIELGLPRDAPAIIEDFEELQARPKVYEEPPEWARRVQPLPDKVFIPNGEGRELGADDEDVSEEFKDLNIIVQMPHIHFV